MVRETENNSPNKFCKLCDTRAHPWPHSLFPSLSHTHTNRELSHRIYVALAGMRTARYSATLCHPVEMWLPQTNEKSSKFFWASFCTLVWKCCVFLVTNIFFLFLGNNTFNGYEWYPNGFIPHILHFRWFLESRTAAWIWLWSTIRVIWVNAHVDFSQFFTEKWKSKVRASETCHFISPVNRIKCKPKNSELSTEIWIIYNSIRFRQNVSWNVFVWGSVACDAHLRRLHLAYTAWSVFWRKTCTWNKWCMD